MLLLLVLPDYPRSTAREASIRFVLSRFTWFFHGRLRPRTGLQELPRVPSWRKSQAIIRRPEVTDSRGDFAVRSESGFSGQPALRSQFLFPSRDTAEQCIRESPKPDEQDGQSRITGPRRGLALLLERHSQARKTCYIRSRPDEDHLSFSVEALDYFLVRDVSHVYSTWRTGLASPHRPATCARKSADVLFRVVSEASMSRRYLVLCSPMPSDSSAVPYTD